MSEAYDYLARMRELFCYDESSPTCLRYKIDRTPKRHAGDQAGAICDGGRYMEVVIHDKKFRIHRVVWALHHGAFPEGLLDHINGNGHDNRITNLRPCNESTNGMNRKLDSRNKTGVKNVCFIEKYNHYRVSIAVNGKMKNFGGFATLEEAEAVATKLRKEHHGQFARHS